MKSILDPKFAYIPAADHGDVSGFRQRQNMRKAAAQGNRPSAPVKLVVPLDQRTQRKS